MVGKEIVTLMERINKPQLRDEHITRVLEALDTKMGGIMKVKTSYTGCRYITAGKEYEVEDSWGRLHTIKDDDGDPITIMVSPSLTCGHLHERAHWEALGESNSPQQCNHFWATHSHAKGYFCISCGKEQDDA